MYEILVQIKYVRIVSAYLVTMPFSDCCCMCRKIGTFYPDFETLLKFEVAL